MRKDDSEAVSSSADGSCIAWDLQRFVRLNAFFASTMFNSILYHPDESQMLTCGSDRKITYWDAGIHIYQHYLFRLLYLIYFCL